MDPTTSGVHHHYLLDYERLGLICESYRITHANRRYELTKRSEHLIVAELDFLFERIAYPYNHLLVLSLLLVVFLISKNSYSCMFGAIFAMFGAFSGKHFLFLHIYNT